MMKFVLISIAVILIGLGIYTYSNQTTEKSHSTPTTISQKKEAAQKVEKPLAATPEETKKKSSAKNITVKSPKVVSKEPMQERENEEEIGKGLTLEGIENSDVSDEEKERLLSELVSQKSYEVRNEPSALPEEDLERLKQIIEQNLK